MNVWDMIIGALIVLAVALALRSMWRARRQGGCASCPYAGSCGKVGRTDATGECEVTHG